MGEALSQLSRLYAPDRSASSRRDFVCLERINPVEHVKHPLQGLHWPAHRTIRYLPPLKAAQYANELLNESVPITHHPPATPKETHHLEGRCTPTPWYSSSQRIGSRGSY